LADLRFEDRHTKTYLQEEQKLGKFLRVKKGKKAFLAGSLKVRIHNNVPLYSLLMSLKKQKETKM
jgi:hypothetical protein